jgi:type VI secretion system protein ImpK
MMNPRFASAVDPILSQAIGMLEMLDRGTALAPEIVRERLLAAIDHGNAIMAHNRSWELARYGLVAWIDEMLVDHPWEGARWWSNNVLEVHLFGTRLCSVRFYEFATEAAKLPERDALEVFYNCVILGFRGMYRQREHAQKVAASLNLPTSLEAWQQVTNRAICQSLEGLEDNAHSVRPIRGARPSLSRQRTVWWLMAALLLLAINLIVYRL